MKCEKLESHTISYQSLLLSTNVLNDKQLHRYGHKSVKLCMYAMPYNDT